MTRRIEQQVRALPEYREADREYREHAEADGRPRHWEDFEGAKPSVSLWSRGERRFASYSVSVGGCGSFEASLWALFEVRGDRLVIVGHAAVGGVPSDFAFLSIVDVDLDGLPDALGGDWNSVSGEADTVTHGTGHGLHFVREINPPFHDCGC